MARCTFFGHRDCPDSIGPTLQYTIEQLILTRSVDKFYVGHQGHFDALVLKTLRELKRQHPEISFYVVLAYLPRREMPYEIEETLYPEGLETIPPRFSIIHRNRWMVEHSDYVVSALSVDFGGAAEAIRYAERIGKEEVRLSGV